MKYTKEYLKKNKIAIDVEGSIDNLKKLDEMYGVNHNYYYGGVPFGEIFDAHSDEHGGRDWYIKNKYKIIKFEELLNIDYEIY